MPETLPTELGATLPALARRAIERHLAGSERLVPGDDPRLRARGASFVTLDKAGELRGCMGSTRPQRPLGEDLVANAISAATADPRFPPVDAAELAGLRIEVSVLSAPEFIDFADERALCESLRPGVDGLILFAGCRNATFLPQVWEQLPDPAMFFAALKQKAGLAPDRPARNLMAARYTVDTWSESG
ncbi:MAG TPA: AmmeMemoRadiSam system protein A [Rhodocyclaceae bacterium]|nr:AmmeMemoRadiSam system protein A [Rhodocyclaceae bacterium]